MSTKLSERDLSVYGDAASGLWRIVSQVQSARMFGTVPLDEEECLHLAREFLSRAMDESGPDTTVEPRFRAMNWRDFKRAEQHWSLRASPVSSLLVPGIKRAETVVMAREELRSLIAPPLWPMPGYTSIVSGVMFPWPPHGADTVDPERLELAWRLTCTIENHARHALVCEIAALVEPEAQFLSALVELHHRGVLAMAIHAGELTLTRFPPLDS